MEDGGRVLYQYNILEIFRELLIEATEGLFTMVAILERDFSRKLADCK